MFRHARNLEVGDFVIIVGRHYRVEEIKFNPKEKTYCFKFKRVGDNIVIEYTKMTSTEWFYVDYNFDSKTATLDWLWRIDKHGKN